MQNSSNIISSIYKARQTIIALMRKLDYNVTDYEHFSVNEVNTMFQNKQMDMLLEKSKEDPRTGRKNKIYILFYLAKAIRPANIQEMIDDLFNLEETLTKEDTLLIVAKDEMNDTLMATLKHTLVPPHRVISDDERALIKTKYNITDDTQFPDISRFDPVAQAICLRPGQICEITRPSKTAIQSIYYRLCI